VDLEGVEEVDVEAVEEDVVEAVVVVDVAEDRNILSVRVYMEVMELLAKGYTAAAYRVGGTLFESIVSTALSDWFQLTNRSHKSRRRNRSTGTNSSIGCC